MTELESAISLSLGIYRQVANIPFLWVVSSFLPLEVFVDCSPLAVFDNSSYLR
jgi:hypothetical protein